MDKTFSEELLNLFRHPARIIISGSTNTGKSHLASDIIVRYESIFNRIVICGVSTHALQNHPKISSKVEVYSNIIDMNDVSPYSDPQKQSLLVLDDNFLTAANSREVVDGFTKGRHNNLSVILITQNLFFPGKYSRTLALNASHYILMKNTDLNQIFCIGRRLFGPKHSSQFVDIYKNVVLKRTHGYLLCDLAPTTPLELQLRTNIVGEPSCEKVYLL